MKTNRLRLPVILILCLIAQFSFGQTGARATEKFNSGWRFNPGDSPKAKDASFNDASWRQLDLPHDWSIEGKFSKNNPAGIGGGALPGGIGWYRKNFTVAASDQQKNIFIDFDGVYCNSEVWINGHYLGKRPNGYISFRYDLTPFIAFGKQNVISVKVDNSQQPNSRWYSGSGIYRNVWLVKTRKVYVDNWGTYITTPKVSAQSATVNINITVRKKSVAKVPVVVSTIIYDPQGKVVAKSDNTSAGSDSSVTAQSFEIASPELWNTDHPKLYKAVSQLKSGNQVLDSYSTTFGIRSFEFDADRGFFLNGKPFKILGVCDHHDLGCLGAAVNTRALERQLEILKEMGCNGIRTSHNPPAPELLDLCDKMGFIVMDEAFDMWKQQKNKFDYHLAWDKWHVRDLEDQLKRDRNHPSVFIWSIGNEIPEQYSKNDTSGRNIARELASIVRKFDNRPITSACNEPNPDNNIIVSGALDLIGYNYHHQDYASFHERFPGKKFIATESTSALETRGFYDMPSDSIRRWPIKWDEEFKGGNQEQMVSAYDNVSAPWGSTHEETWKVMKKHPFLSGMYIWTGFDYIGEPTPYSWPSRSSYFGIIDLAGFPKDVYYMYQSEWTNKPVLHIFPHWNWPAGKVVDVWAYYNNADEVELFLNGKSLGVKKKTGDDLHIQWRVNFEPGTLKAISRKDGKIVLEREIHTAGKASSINLTADRKTISADGEDLSFVTVNIVDERGNLVPDADNLVTFKIKGDAKIAGVDNGLQTSMEPFKANDRKAFNGKCLAVIQSGKTPGKVTLVASSVGLPDAELVIDLK
ncbi:DUF4982 domain-containing protein [Pedobacter sp. HMF7647]|uniref:DUF4982 domain-containing protein n=1 Tax=Hufsiella arboris TaxID=2695275 RepID=A0A7K1Y5C0_9SPHI|nr:beta-galactosidase GalB [Hufsiella arboris]MXV49561.1 DUF4982 domain-containing protein [Hufsiella arboris]